MIRNVAKLNRFYARLMKRERISYRQALAIFEALHKEARALGVINSRNILEGLEVDIRIAKAIHRLPS